MALAVRAGHTARRRFRQISALFAECHRRRLRVNVRLSWRRKLIYCSSCCLQGITSLLHRQRHNTFSLFIAYRRDTELYIAPNEIPGLETAYSIELINVVCHATYRFNWRKNLHNSHKMIFMKNLGYSTLINVSWNNKANHIKPLK